MIDSKPQNTPMCFNTKLSLMYGMPLQDAKQYRSIIGDLQYLTHTRSNIAFSVNKLSQFLKAPTTDHWIACTCIFRYLAGTMYHALHFSLAYSITLRGFADADSAGSIDDRKSTSLLIVFSWGIISLVGAPRNKVLFPVPVPKLSIDLFPWLLLRLSGSNHCSVSSVFFFPIVPLYGAIA